jgi:pyruvate-formate lyase
MNEENTFEVMDEELFFDPADFADEVDTGDHTEETEPVEETSEETGTEPIETTTETPETTETAEQPEETNPVLIPVKFLGETKQLTIEEATPWIQKGMNHDRILQQRDDLQQFKTQNEESLLALDRIASMLEIEGANPKEVRDNLLRAMEKNVRRQRGESEAEAEANIRADKANRQLQSYQSQEQAARQQQMAAQQRQQRDIQEFVQRYPGLDPKTIPTSVWQDVRKGETLVNAYGKYEMQQMREENQRLQQQLNAKAQNDKNKENSLGSMQSGSATPKTDPFLDELFRD